MYTFPPSPYYLKSWGKSGRTRHAWYRSLPSGPCTVGFRVSSVVGSSKHHLPDLPGPFDTTQRQNQSIQSRLIIADSLFGWASSLESACWKDILAILNNSRKESTRKRCVVKWKWFFIWAQNHHPFPAESDIFAILDYLLSLKTTGLSIHVFLAAISPAW